EDKDLECDIRQSDRQIAAWLRGQERTELSNSLEEIYLQNLGESILFLWVEKIKDVLVVKSQTSDPGNISVLFVQLLQRTGPYICWQQHNQGTTQHSLVFRKLCLIVCSVVGLSATLRL
uniref:Impact RWD domain protein n=1 Tax=Callorhinchus milii TaxID=7868 RepID=A0A4W3GX38_CALMI